MLNGIEMIKLLQPFIYQVMIWTALMRSCVELNVNQIALTPMKVAIETDTPEMI